MSDEPDAVQIQMDIQSAVDEAVRNIREHALRQVMVMVSKMEPMDFVQRAAQFTTNFNAPLDSHTVKDSQLNYRTGFIEARTQIYDKIEAMIAKDAAMQHEQ